MKLIRAAVLAIAVLCSDIVHAGLPTSISKQYLIQANVDIAGHIASIQPEEKLSDEYLQAMQKVAKTWQFGVPRINEKPLASTTWLRVQFVHVREKDGSYDYIARYLGNGPYIEMTRISYPTHLYRWNINAIFFIRLVVEPNATIDQIQLFQVLTTDGKPIGDALQDVIQGISKWKVKPMLVDGHPVATTMIVPVRFFITHSIDVRKPNFGFMIASDSPNPTQSLGNIPEMGTVSP